MLLTKSLSALENCMKDRIDGICIARNDENEYPRLTEHTKDFRTLYSGLMNGSK